ncbi:unnamed protein product [Closterium sp. NIES-53]
MVSSHHSLPLFLPSYPISPYPSSTSPPHTAVSLQATMRLQEDGIVTPGLFSLPPLLPVPPSHLVSLPLPHASISLQATMKLQEDGIVTPALFSLLVGNPRPAAEPATKPAPELPAKPSTEPSSSSSSQVSPRAPPATREKREIERYARSDLEMGQRRVFLLGENRWEDPNTLIGRGGEEVEGKEEGGEEEEEEERGEVEGKGKGRGGRDLVDVKGKGKGKKGKKGGDGGLKPVVVSCYQCRGERNVVCMGELFVLALVCVCLCQACVCCLRHVSVWVLEGRGG